MIVNLSPVSICPKAPFNYTNDLTYTCVNSEMHDAFKFLQYLPAEKGLATITKN